jgi:hypothetical protein
MVAISNVFTELVIEVFPMEFINSGPEKLN